MRLAGDDLYMPSPDHLKSDLLADLVRRFGTARVAVTGSSMLPAIWPGDVVKVRHCDSAELRVGQIVLALGDGKLVAHRIRSIAGDRIVTQGDSMPQRDPPFAAAEILGQVVAILRDGRDIPLQQSPGQRFASSILRRSDFCLRMTLRIGRRCQWLRHMELLWAR